MEATITIQSGLTEKVYQLWVCGGEYIKFIHPKRGKFYRAVLECAYPLRSEHVARKRCKTASEAQAYGKLLSQRYLLAVMAEKVRREREALKETAQ
jgi:hypothetical protein